MKKFSTTITIFLFWIVFLGETSLSWADDELTNEQKLACESILCLSSGDRPDECGPALNYFFSIKKKKLSDTRDARKSFLKKCPDSNAEGMPSLINVLVDYNCSSCTVEQLNKNLVKVVISTGRNLNSISNHSSGFTVMAVDPELPAYCLKYYAAMNSNQYTAYSQYSQSQPVYIGSNIGRKVQDDDGNEYYVIYAKSRNEQTQIAEAISQNHWEWAN